MIHGTTNIKFTKGDRVENVFVFIHEGDWPLPTHITLIDA